MTQCNLSDNLSSMKMIIILTLFCMSAIAQLSTNKTVRLMCKYSFEVLDASEIQSSTIIAYGNKREDGTYYFNTSENGISNYSFTNISGELPQVMWHHDSRIQLDAHLNSNKLTYQFKIFNYAGSHKLEIVFDEKRERVLYGLSYLDESRFNYRDGILIDSYVNQNSWVNERSISIDGCRLDIY